MKKLVYNFFKENPCSTYHQCAAELKIDEIAIVKIINELLKENYLNSHVSSLDKLSQEGSSFYSIGKHFPE